jgi:predicted DNA-binding protein (UPF0251 family)
MPEAENHLLPGATNDVWRTWLMTGAHRAPVDRRRMRGANRGLKKILIEGMANGDGHRLAWKDFSGAMVRHAVDEAMRTLPPQDKQAVKLAYFGGYSNREIAQQIGLTEGAVQRRLRRALAAISEYIQHGRAIGRRALYVVAVWLSGRWVSDMTHHAVQAAAVATATVIILAHPAPGTATPPTAPPTAQPHAATQAGAQGPGTAAAPVVPPTPSTTAPATSGVAATVAAPPVSLPPVSVPAVQLPVPLPPLPAPPIKVKPLP